MLALVPVSSAILPFQRYSLYHKLFLSPASVLSSGADSRSLPSGKIQSEYLDRPSSVCFS